MTNTAATNTAAAESAASESAVAPGPLSLVAPSRSFASDNAAGAHPLVIDAIIAANEGHALAYGEDAHTAQCELAFNKLFDAEVDTRLAFNGTGANVMALATMMGSISGPHHAVVCSNWAHITVDETGAPERILGTKLLEVDCDDAKITPAQLHDVAHLRGNVHHVQPGIVSLTQPTELGTLYTIDEIAELCEVAHGLNMLVHVDGARIANATAALGGTRETLRAFTIGAGVDVISFGGTKTGGMNAEAAIFLNHDAGVGSEYVRKQVTQLGSKMRYLAAQFNALLADDLWIALGAQTNAMAQSMYEQAAAVDGVEAGVAPAVNSMYPILNPAAIRTLQDWSFFWDWDELRHQVRWMTSWDTTQEDVDAFVAGLKATVGS